MLDVRLERALSEDRAKTLSASDQALWQACKSSHRFLAAEHKVIVQYSLKDGSPANVRYWECVEVDLNIRTGLSSVWAHHKKSVRVGHTPKLIGNGCFMWHPFGSEIQMVKWGERDIVRFSMMYRTQANPETRQEGVSFLLEQNIFDSMFGQM